MKKFLLMMFALVCFSAYAQQDFTTQKITMSCDGCTYSAYTDGQYTGAVDGVITVVTGSRFTLRLTKRNYRFALQTLTVNGEEMKDKTVVEGNQTVLELESVNEDLEIKAVFALPEKKKYTVKVLNPTDGEKDECWYGELRDSNGFSRFQYDDAEGLTVDEGTSVRLIIMPPKTNPERWDIDKVMYDGNDVTANLVWLSENKTLFLGPINANHTVVITQKDLAGIDGVATDSRDMKLAGGVIEAEGDIEVSDMWGRIVARGNGSVDMKRMSKGVYVARVGAKTIKIHN